MDGQIHCSGPKVRQTIMVEGLLHSWQPGSKEREWRKGHREDPTPVTLLLRPRPPAHSHHPVSPFKLGSSSHDPVVSPLKIPALAQESGWTPPIQTITEGERNREERREGRGERREREEGEKGREK